MHALSAQLSWTHLRQIVYLDDPLKRDFYAEMCRLERWSTRTLEKKIRGMLYERTALAKKPDAVIRHELDALSTLDHKYPHIFYAAFGRACVWSVAQVIRSRSSSRSLRVNFHLNG